MSEAKTTIFDYPYFEDGQFALENMQEELAKKYLESEKAESHFYRQQGSAFADLRLLDWDSQFFHRKLSRLTHFTFKSKQEGMALWRQCESWLKSEKVEHVTFRVDAREVGVINLLMNNGFEIVSGKYLTRRSLDELESFKEAASLQFSRTTASDVDVLKALACRNFKESRFFSDNFFDSKIAGGVYESWIANKFKDKPEEVILVSEGANTIGFVILSTLRPLEDRQFGFIELITVDSSEAGKGYGKRIIRYALRHIAELGNTIVFANIVNTNLSSLRMFQGVGFEVYATLLDMRRLV